MIECGWNKTLSAETLEIEMIEIIQFVAPKNAVACFDEASVCVCVGVRASVGLGID